MKKAVLLLVVLAYFLSFVGCSLKKNDAITECSTIASITSETAVPVLMESEQAVRNAANEVLIETYPNVQKIGLINFKIEIRPHARIAGRYNVSYDFILAGYSTFESYTVILTENGNGSFDIQNVYSSNKGLYSKFLDSCTEERIESAKRSIEEQSSKYGDATGFYLDVSDSGSLRLNTEFIVQITTLESLLGKQGCDIDHKHVFFSEVICGTE